MSNPLTRSSLFNHGLTEKPQVGAIGRSECAMPTYLIRATLLQDKEEKHEEIK